MVAKKLITLYALLFSCFFFNFREAISQGSHRTESIFEHLSEEEAGRLTLEADLTTLLEDRSTTDYIPALLTLSTGKSYQVKIKPKGKFRRKVAAIPPLKIKFSKKTLIAEGLDTLNEFKLVLPCYDNNLGDELIIREYLAYRMFEHLTAACVRARLVRVTLRDTHVEKSRKNMFALLVEDNEETAARLNGAEVERYGLPADSLILNQLALVTLFEYMIGNTDWDIPMMRNVRLIQSTETDRILAVPYDFDFSGFVSAPYASPSSESGLISVRDRFLMANGVQQEALRRASQQLRSAKDDLYALCRSKYLSRESAAEITAYLETFFQQIDQNGDVPARMHVPLGD